MYWLDPGAPVFNPNCHNKDYPNFFQIKLKYISCTQQPSHLQQSMFTHSEQCVLRAVRQYPDIHEPTNNPCTYSLKQEKGNINVFVGPDPNLPNPMVPWTTEHS